jgi:hypothetical protein
MQGHAAGNRGIIGPERWNMEPHRSTIVIDGISFLIEVVERDGQWTAIARREDSGDRYGPSISAATPNEAVGQLIGWIDWQREHASALEALQAAEVAYQRIVASSAFYAGPEGPPPAEVERDALARLEEARVRLDEVRQRRPA